MWWWQKKDSFWRFVHSVNDVTEKGAPLQGALQNHNGKG